MARSEFSDPSAGIKIRSIEGFLYLEFKRGCARSSCVLPQALRKLG